MIPFVVSARLLTSLNKSLSSLTSLPIRVGILLIRVSKSWVLELARSRLVLDCESKTHAEVKVHETLYWVQMLTNGIDVNLAISARTWHQPQWLGHQELVTSQDHLQGLNNLGAEISNLVWRRPGHT